MTPVRTLSLPLPEPNLSEIRRYAKCPTGAENEIGQCLSLLSDLRGQVCYCECRLQDEEDSLDMEFAKTSSSALKKALFGCEKILLFAATVGRLPDREIARFTRVSPAKALILQAVGTERIEAACDAFCEQMKKEYAARGFVLGHRFSPGYGDLPLTLQKDVFRVLDCPKNIGVSLSESLLMMPSKSVTAVIGIRKQEMESDE